MKQESNPFDLYECPNPLHFHELGKRFAFGYQVARTYWAAPGPNGTVSRTYLACKRIYSSVFPDRVQFSLILGRLALTLAYLKKPAAPAPSKGATPAASGSSQE